MSFEVFPPKPGVAIAATQDAVLKIAELKPSFISVTYGAGGSTSENSAKFASFVQNDCGVPALAHFTCVNASRESLLAEAARFKEYNIENVLCLRGDVPQGQERGAAFANSEFLHACDLVKLLKENTDFCLGGACYPECHPECQHIDEDIGYLRLKVEAGLEFMTTQMFFDNDIYFRYVGKLRDKGVTIPIVAGIMPVVNAKLITRISALSGTYLPPRFKTLVDKFGDNNEAMFAAGVAYAEEQIVDLYASGVKAVHIYTMNRPEIASRIFNDLYGIIH